MKDNTYLCTPEQNNLIKQYYETLQNKTKAILKDKTSTYLIYKGFKITKWDDGTYTMEDVSKSDFYERISKKDLKLINKYGVEKGIDVIRYNKDVKRVEYYKVKIADVYDDKQVFVKKLRGVEVKQSDVNFFIKKIKNFDLDIDYAIELLFYYEFRIKWFKKIYGEFN